MANQVTQSVPSIEQIAARIRAEHKAKHPPVYPVDADEYDRRLALHGERFDSRLPYISYGEGGL